MEFQVPTPRATPRLCSEQLEQQLQRLMAPNPEMAFASLLSFGPASRLRLPRPDLDGAGEFLGDSPHPSPLLGPVPQFSLTFT